MRELKFRGRCIKTGKFVYGGGIDTQRDTPRIMLHGTSTYVDAKTIGQYTGLTDKKGTQVFEGDVVYLAGHGDYEVEFPFIELYEAAAENDMGGIIGNIHENPELLDA